MTISIIVPVFKVEPYLDECVESLVRQSFTDIEIILVDDGSPDHCPQMCDDWAKKDRRIRVIHKPNGGLSDARNVGLDYAQGDYITFVDSDDILNPEACQKMLSGFALADNVAIVGILPYKYPIGVEGLNLEKWYHADGKPLIVEPEDFCLALLRQDVCHTACCKLFKADLFKHQRFMKGRNNEDTRFFYEISRYIEENKMRLVEQPDLMYAYRMHGSSICHNPEMLDFDIIKNLIDIRESTYHTDVRKYALSTVINLEYQYMLKYCGSNNYNWLNEDFRKSGIVDAIRIFGFSKSFIIYTIIRYFPAIWRKHYEAKYGNNEN